MKVYIINTKGIGKIDYSFLDSEIINHIEQHKDKKTKNCSLFAYLLLTSLIKDLKIDFVGKPNIINSKIKFNISHTGAYVCLVISSNEVGVDIEYKNRIIGTSLKSKMLSKEELDAYKNLSLNEENYIHLWTKKEAYLKYLGKGINQRLDEIDTTSLAFNTIEHQELFISIYGEGVIENVYLIDKKNFKTYLGKLR